MRRITRALTALALAVLAGPARGAEISRVATSGEPGNPFDIDISARWDRTVENAIITHEVTVVPSGTPGGLLADSAERLRYTRTRHAIVPRIAVGLWKDVELHAELPYVLGDDREWRYGSYNGVTSGPNPTDPQSIAGNLVDAAGRPCVAPSPCDLFAVEPSTFGYHGGKVGDLEAGLAWAVFSELKDDTKPTWVVGFDVTFPTADKWDPSKDRTRTANADGVVWESPYRVQDTPGPFGEKIWKWDLYTVLSKRYGVIDPYVKAHAQFSFKSSSTYSNCDGVTAATDPALAVQQMNAQAAANCDIWGSAADAKLPFVAGLVFGSEVIPYEDLAEHQRLSLDFRVFADTVTSARFYNELTDATGKLHQTEGYLEVGGLAGLYLRASKYVQLRAVASFATRTAHDLTGESYGRNGVTDAGVAANPDVNPNFDWRYDAPGRRFRISEVTVFDLSLGFVLQF